MAAQGSARTWAFVVSVHSCDVSKTGEDRSSTGVIARRRTPVSLNIRLCRS